MAQKATQIKKKQAFCVADPKSQNLFGRQAR